MMRALRLCRTYGHEPSGQPVTFVQSTPTSFFRTKAAMGAVVPATESVTVKSACSDPCAELLLVACMRMHPVAPGARLRELGAPEPSKVSLPLSNIDVGAEIVTVWLSLFTKHALSQ